MDATRARRGARTSGAGARRCISLLASIGADDLEAIAARCYLDLLRGGYTAVAEFLYLHRLTPARTVRRRADPCRDADADQAVARAAARVRYPADAAAGAVSARQLRRRRAERGRRRRFIRSTGQFLQDLDELRRRYPPDGDTRLGVAFHSLRAVDVDTIADVSAQLAAGRTLRGDSYPCRRAARPKWPRAASITAATPVALLAERGLLGPRWALVHGTHTTAEELEQLAGSGATLVLCPTTEADLGDGCCRCGSLS